jgi:putative redox protein
MDLITVTREEGLRFSIHIRDHVMTTDMSVRDGGKDGGPAPVEIMGASMGACLATLVQAYCDARGYTDGDVAVSLTIEMVDNPNRVGGFVADVELPKDVPEKDKEKLKKMCLRLPIPASLRAEPRVDIEMF